MVRSLIVLAGGTRIPVSLSREEVLSALQGGPRVDFAFGSREGRRKDGELKASVFTNQVVAVLDA
jgi:hypothetical protein